MADAAARRPGTRPAPLPGEAAARRPPRTGIALTDARGRVHHWDGGAEELTGIGAGEALGRELADVLASSHGFRHRLARALDGVARSGEPGDPLPLPRTAGRRVVRLHPLRPPGTVAAVFSDATGPARGDERSELLAAAFERSPVPTAVFDAGLRYVGVNRALQAVNGLPEPPHLGRSITDMLLSFGFTAEQAARVQAVAAEVRRTGTPAQDTLFTSAPDSVAPSGRWWKTRWYRLEGPRDRVLGVGVDVTDVTAREQVAAQARAGQQRLALLAGAGRKVGTTLDPDRTCRELAELFVPALADHAAVDVVSSALRRGRPLSGTWDAPLELRRVALRTHGPAAERLRAAVHGVGRTFTVPASSVLHRCVAGNRPILLADLRAAARDRGVRDLPAMKAGTDSGMTSMLLVPLYARATPLGVVLLARYQDRPAFEEDDLSLAAELAARVAVSLDNAHLYEREREVAATLQRRLLPQEAAHRPGVHTCHRHLADPQTPGAAGGDWLDVVPLPGVRTALVVGDAMGKGVEAAALMGQLRTNLRSLLTLGMPADEALWNLDRLVSQAEESPLATCLVLVYDPVSGRCTATSAGHPPPLVRFPDGSTSYLEVPPAVPLGVGGVPFDTVDIDPPDGSLLVLYTDGLVQDGGCDVGGGMRWLRDTVRGHRGDVAALCDRLVGPPATGRREDDVALLVAQVRTLPRGDVVSWDLAADPGAPRRARHLVGRQLAAWHLDDLVDITELLVSELVTNAVRHGTPPITLRLLRLDRLRCEVSDHGRMLPHMRLAGPADEGGRGMHIVSMLGCRWGADRTNDGKTVWWEQDLGTGSDRTGPEAPLRPGTPPAPG
nr:SpoIIE family protein phosphatase [Streptomyces sp. Xyl84]